MKAFGSQPIAIYDAYGNLYSNSALSTPGCRSPVCPIRPVT